MLFGGRKRFLETSWERALLKCTRLRRDRRDGTGQNVAIVPYGLSWTSATVGRIVPSFFLFQFVLRSFLGVSNARVARFGYSTSTDGRFVLLPLALFVFRVYPGGVHSFPSRRCAHAARGRASLLSSPIFSFPFSPRHCVFFPSSKKKKRNDWLCSGARVSPPSTNARIPHVTE